MAINPNSTYPPPATTAPDASYPYGASANESSPGALDGFPFEKAGIDDIMGFLQAIWRALGVAPSGTSETALVSQTLRGLQTLANSANFFTDSGAADAYEFSPRTNQQGPDVYVVGMVVRAEIANTNLTASPTINVNSLGVKTITGVAIGDLVAGILYSFEYDGTNFIPFSLGSHVLDQVNVGSRTLASGKLFTMDGLTIAADNLITGGSTPAGILTGSVNGKNIDATGTLLSSRSGGFHSLFYNPVAGGQAGSIANDGSGVSFNISSDPDLKIKDESLLKDSVIESQFNIIEECTYGFWWKNKKGEKDEDQGPKIGWNARKACELRPMSGLGTPRDSGTWDYKIGEVYKTETVPEVREVKADGIVKVKAVPEHIIEHIERPASVDNGKPMPIVIKMVSILRKKLGAQDKLIKDLIDRLDKAGIK